MKLKTIFKIMMLFLMLFATPVNLKAQEAFIIDDYDISMIVDESGAIHVQETLQLDFNEYRHGFYRNLPTTYHMNWNINGDSISKDYFFPIKNITTNVPKSISTDQNGIVIRLGDEDKRVIGKQLYTISYTVQTKDLDLDGIQMLYWNLVDNFDTTIQHLSFSIELPKPFDPNEVYVYSGLYGSLENQLSFQVNDNTIRGETTASLSNYEAATIKINLPKDYFHFPAPKNYTLLLGIISSVIILLAFVLFMKFGKDDELIIPVEFSAPQGLNSAGVGYVIDGIVENRDVLSLIIEWANHGYLHIREENKKLTLIKLKEIESDILYEKRFFNAIFEKKDEVSEEDLKKASLGIKLNEAKQQVSQYFNSDKKRKIIASSSIGMQILLIFIIMLTAGIFIYLNAYAYFETAAFTFPYILLALLFASSTIPWIPLMKKRYVMKSMTFFLSCIGISILNIIILLITMALMYWKLKTPVLAIIIFPAVMSALTIIMIFMEKRTEQGNRWLGQVLGLKDFIENCEKEQLEMFVNDNPSAFFSILPYAYVLGISDIWVNKFEDLIIAQPDWYETNHPSTNFSTILWWSHFNRHFNSFSSAAAYIPAPKSSTGGGSIGGGSFGGGFSGGGFGGGGGGSW